MIVNLKISRLPCSRLHACRACLFLAQIHSEHQRLDLLPIAQIPIQTRRIAVAMHACHQVGRVVSQMPVCQPVGRVCVAQGRFIHNIMNCRV